MDIWESLSKNLLKWLLGVVAGLMVAGLYGGFKFYSEIKEYKAREEAEKRVIESRIFDTPEQKEETKSHIKEAPPALEQHLKIERDKDFQKKIEETLKRQDCLLIRLNDQYYQHNQEIRRNRGN